MNKNIKFVLFLLGEVIAIDEVIVVWKQFESRNKQHFTLDPHPWPPPLTLGLDPQPWPPLLTLALDPQPAAGTLCCHKWCVFAYRRLKWGEWRDCLELSAGSWQLEWRVSISICFPTKISRISAKPTGLLLAVFESNTPTVAYCTLWNETKQNEICTLQNETQHFHEKLLWRSFCEPSIFLQSFLLWHRRVIFWTADKNKTIFTAFLLRIAWTKLVLSIVLSPPLLSAPGGSALLCFATRWLHKFDISTPPTRP